MFASRLSPRNKGPHPWTLPMASSIDDGNYYMRQCARMWIVTGSRQWNVRRVSTVPATCSYATVKICEDTTPLETLETKDLENAEDDTEGDDAEGDDTEGDDAESDTFHIWYCDCGECPESSSNETPVDDVQFLSRAERRAKEEKEDDDWHMPRQSPVQDIAVTVVTANLTVCTGPEHTWHRCGGFEMVEQNELGHVAVRNDKVTSPRGTNYLVVPKPNSLSRSKSGDHTMVIMRDEPAYELPGYCAGFAAEAAIAQIVARDVEERNRQRRLAGKPMLEMMRGATYWTERKRRGKKREGDIIVTYAIPGTFVDTPHGKKQLYRVVQVIEVKNTRTERSRAKGFEQLYWMKHSTSDETKWMVDNDGVHFRFDDDTDFLFASVRGGEAATSVGHVLEWMRVTMIEQSCGVRRAAEAAAAAETAASRRTRPSPRSRSSSRQRNKSSPSDNKNWRRRGVTKPNANNIGSGSSSGDNSGGWTTMVRKKKWKKRR